MAKYLDREAALSIREPPKSNRHYQTDNLDDAYGQGWDDALCCIERLPTADVVSVRHGRWIHTDYAIHWTAKDECSECAYHTCDRDDLSKYNYCPNCGADMLNGG